jgi:hypothetical protein
MIDKISIVPYEKEADRKSAWVFAEKINKIIDCINANVVPVGESGFLKNNTKEGVDYITINVDKAGAVDSVWGEEKIAILAEIDKLIRNWQYAQRSDYSIGYVEGLRISRGIVANHLL